MTIMDKTTIKIWKETRKKLKILAAKVEKPMTQLLDELVDEALQKELEKGG
jgi:predicted DNA-binding protein